MSQLIIYSLFHEPLLVNSKSKYCKGCHKYKATRFFYDGRNKCKSCEKKQHKEIHSREHPIAEFKTCACCGFVKSRTDFALDKTQTDGLHSHCKECQREARLHNKTNKMIVKPKSRKRFAHE